MRILETAFPMGTCMSDKVSMGNFVTGCPRLDSTEKQIMNSWKLLEDGDITKRFLIYSCGGEKLCQCKRLL